jgi:hypothetical protein
MHRPCPTGAWATAGITSHRPTSPWQPRHCGRPGRGDRPDRAPWPGSCGLDSAVGRAAVVKPRAKFGLYTIHSFNLFQKSFFVLIFLK